MGDGLDGNFWEDGLPSCVQSKLEYLHRCSAHNFLWQFVPVRDYLKAECMLTATGLTPLLVNLQSMTSKPNAGGGTKECVTWKVEEDMHNFVHADKVTTDSSITTGAMWECFEDLREKPSAFMRVKADQCTPDFQFSYERVSHVGLCTWLEYWS